MRLTKKQRLLIEEAINFIESNDLIFLQKASDRVKNSNPYIEHILSILDVYDSNGFTDKDQVIEWSLNNLKFSISPMANVNKFSSPDPY